MRFAIAILSTGALLRSGYGGQDEKEKIESDVAEAVRPVMEKFTIPGMAVGIVLNGQIHVFNYGLMSKATGKLVDDDTLFEIGSVSKTFTATLASYAQVNGQLSLSDAVTRYLPVLRGSTFDNVTLLHLGTHMSGGLPLQVPGEVKNDNQLMDYFKNWKPTYAPGTYRTYSNPSIGLLGLITARSMKADFAELMESTLFPALGLKNTYINVPNAQKARYAQGYTDKDEPIRMTPGVLWQQAYGVRTTAGDLARFVAANIDTVQLDPKWQRAIADTHIGYYRVGAMTQDLVWEQYSCPVASKDLVWGNSPEVSYKANAAEKIDPPSPPRGDVLINKTGSTNGFGTYVAFVPAKGVGVVLLANKPYPYGARVTLLQEILKRLIDPPPIN